MNIEDESLQKKAIEGHQIALDLIREWKQYEGQLTIKTINAPLQTEETLSSRMAGHSSEEDMKELEGSIEKIVSEARDPASRVKAIAKGRKRKM